MLEAIVQNGIILLVNMFGMLDIWLVLKMLFGCDMKLNAKTMTISSVTFLVLYGVVNFALLGHNNLITAITYGYIVVVTLILTRSKRWKAMLLTIPAVLIYVQFCSIVDLFGKLMSWDKIILFESAETKVTPTFLVSDVLMFGIMILIDRHCNKKAIAVQLSLAEGIILTLFCVFLPFIELTLEYIDQVANHMVFHWAWMIFVLILNGAVVYAIVYRKRAGYYKQVLHNYKETFDSEYSYFQNYKEKQEETIKFRHDWKNHMIVLQKMLSEGEHEKAEEYFAQLSSGMAHSGTQVLTGNEMVDMIISTKGDVLEEHSIELAIKGTLTEWSFMNPVDCCVLFSNLLDNAIEANMQVEGKRSITMVAKKTNDMLYFEMKNPRVNEIVKEGAAFLSTKNEEGTHGIGLQNVIGIVEQYKGSYQIETPEKEFKIQIMMPVRE